MKTDEQLKKMLAEITRSARQRRRRAAAPAARTRNSGYTSATTSSSRSSRNIRKEQSLQDEEKFQAALKQEGMTWTTCGKQLERQMLIEQVQRQEVGSKLTITEAEARSLLRAASEGFTEPASITLREILVDVPTTEGRRRRIVPPTRRDEAAQKKIGDCAPAAEGRRGLRQGRRRRRPTRPRRRTAA